MGQIIFKDINANPNDYELNTYMNVKQVIAIIFQYYLVIISFIMKRIMLQFIYQISI